MSRIDEALTRVWSNVSGDRSSIASAQQRQFASAWEPEVVSRTEAGPALREEKRILRDTPRNPSFPVLNAACGERLISDTRCDPVLVEQFRRLAALLHKTQIQVAERTRVVMVTSASPADGKTLTAINLAVVLSGSYGLNVLLIDADLRRPSIGGLTGLEGQKGLSEALKAKVEQKLTLIELTPTLTVLPGGAPDSDPTAGLASQRMRDILEESAERFDWVIVDAPPVGACADSHLIAEIVDGILFVVRASSTEYTLAKKAIEVIGQEKILGLVFNGVEQGTLQDYGQYYGVS